jgi:hypothetical protein
LAFRGYYFYGLPRYNLGFQQQDIRDTDIGCHQDSVNVALYEEHPNFTERSKPARQPNL